MDFWKAILGLIRRKYVGLPILIAAIAMAAMAFLLSPNRYTSSTMLVLTTPTSGGTLSQDPSKPAGLTNPLLNFDDGLKTTSAILIQAMNTPEVARDLGAAGGPSKLTINDGSGNPELFGVNGPFVFIEGESTSADEARALVERAQQRVRDELLNRQKALNAPPSTYITMTDVVAPSAPEIQRGEQLQIAVAALVLTLVTGLAGAYGAERVLAARRRRPPPLTDAAPPDPDVNPVDPATVRFAPVSSSNGTPPKVNGSGVSDRVRSR
ncbi:MAG TPA: hypothetical protein VGX25_10750 [Actinophytocola sp.]|uniref:hypothetical protein n=1 Tax=Actinophytocola sp. TaxID=1872138 RepID=UPI002DDCF76E|nr:hypothetical protein [Actinophytocola sp.]HEV2779865.1 hypothetical protein [Actinophytocola sp.]